MGMELYRHAESDPLVDVAVSHALLERAGRDGVGAVRLWRPRRAALSLGRLDVRGPNAERLAELARRHEATPVRRLAGGRAAVVDAGCLCLGWAQPQAVMAQSSARYRLLAGVIGDALVRVGVVSSIGESTGEWCPGTWSLQGPDGKLAGLAQRVIGGAAWCEALIVVERSANSSLLGRHVHEALSIPWRAEAQGQLATSLRGEGDPYAALGDALIGSLGRTWPGLDDRPLPTEVGERALTLAAGHRWP